MEKGEKFMVDQFQSDSQGKEIGSTKITQGNMNSKYFEATVQVRDSETGKLLRSHHAKVGNLFQLDND